MSRRVWVAGIDLGCRESVEISFAAGEGQEPVEDRLFGRWQAAGGWN